MFVNIVSRVFVKKITIFRMDGKVFAVKIFEVTSEEDDEDTIRYTKTCIKREVEILHKVHHGMYMLSPNRKSTFQPKLIKFGTNFPFQTIYVPLF